MNRMIMPSGGPDGARRRPGPGDDGSFSRGRAGPSSHTRPRRGTRIAPPGSGDGRHGDHPRPYREPYGGQKHGLLPPPAVPNMTAFGTTVQGTQNATEKP